MYHNSWFAGRLALRSPSREAVRDCSAAGGCDEAVAYWIEKLNFDGPAWLIREHLKGCGAWDTQTLCDHQGNRGRLFWLWCCQIAQSGDDTLYLMR